MTGGISAGGARGAGTAGNDAVSTEKGGAGNTSSCGEDLGPDNSADFTPECASPESFTAAGEEPMKGVACTEADVQVCYRTCGPLSIGFKTETCTAGGYAEGDCQFPTGVDYGCFAIPDAIDTAVCPTAEPQATEPCDVPECTLCNVDGTYFDSGGNAKEGYCVCREPNSDGERSWTCASATAWPCPLGACCSG